MIPIVPVLYSIAPSLSASGAARAAVVVRNHLAVAVKRWAVAYMSWRTAAAIAQLWLLSDQQLNDIGLTRSDMSDAVREARHHAFRGDLQQGAPS
jgi:uncharacterized protein YjiS (DUF1127 family)